MTTDTLCTCSDVLSKIFLYAWIFPLINRTNLHTNGRSSSTTSPRVPLGLHERWLDVLNTGYDLIGLRILFGWHIDFKRHFKTVLISQRCFGGGFYFLDSFSFDVVVLVLCFVKVMKRGVRCNSTYLANRKGDYDYLLWRRMAGFDVVEQFGSMPVLEESGDAMIPLFC